ncbi:putative phosphatase regulatory subunit-domain-containing protein [Halteromyces radiatus]|uniref:putative phosphatase regulatory subunit-domain-containing protein n=1 Tax=Halteromyces radiatus TaxID=101107 RepID=UPI0022205027|nr:putative phosphatase regulatory subunit-domain-containing protein [Halteromyces radiatus]KAI8080031.1 putative phosphatase regulatory subunit-domain-containing protein [Halteromyces radiatus]
MLTQHQPKRRVSINNRYGNQRRPLPSPSPLINNEQKKKTVRFCSDDALEQVRLFIKTQTPLAVRKGDPPLLTQQVRYDIQYPGWPSKWTLYKSLSQSAIRMESVQLMDHPHHGLTKVLFGRCRVSNLAYEKQVIIRYSFDYWQTYQEINAIYREPIASTSNTWDRFTFEIGFPSTSTTMTCWIALRYNVNGQEFWDNNDGKNYQVDILRTNLVSSPPTTPPLELSDNDDDDEEEDDPFLDQPNNNKNTSPLQALDQLKLRYNFSNARYQPTNTLSTMMNNNTTTTHPYHQHTLPTSLHVGYQDFISKYCFYNSSPPSSIVQN